MANRFRLSCPVDQYGTFTRPPKPTWLINCEASKRAKISVQYWTKIYWATPPWLNPEQLEQMKKIYLDAPEGSHVDHIVPLKSEYVCGLHVPWNLEAISPSENYKKSNRHWPHCPKHLCPIHNATLDMFKESYEV